MTQTHAESTKAEPTIFVCGPDGEGGHDMPVSDYEAAIAAREVLRAETAEAKLAEIVKALKTVRQIIDTDPSDPFEAYGSRRLAERVRAALSHLYGV